MNEDFALRYTPVRHLGSIVFKNISNCGLGIIRVYATMVLSFVKKIIAPLLENMLYILRIYM